MHDEATPGLKYNNQRFYHTRLGRFPQRDPWMANPFRPSPGDGYPDGLNTYAGYHILHGGVDPSGMDWSTGKGVGPLGGAAGGWGGGRSSERRSLGCCSDKLYYDNTCCCRKGKTGSTSKSGGVILESKNIKTGVKRCCKKNRSIPITIPTAIGDFYIGTIRNATTHCWIEYPGGAVGFYPGGVVPNDHYAGTRGPYTTCEEEELNPCNYNIRLFIYCLSKQASNTWPDYQVGWFDCRHFSKQAISRCKNVAKGSCGLPK